LLWGRSQEAASEASAIRIPQEGAEVASEGLASGQLGARIGRIYALTLVGDGGCDDNEGCPIEVKLGDESSFVARLSDTKGAASRVSAIPRTSESVCGV